MKRTAGLKTLLGLLALCLPLCAEVPCVWTGVERVVAVGDLHGDYANFIAILEGTKIVDKELHWAAGRTHLVQTGDILDRGDKAKDILDFLINLEKEADAAGGHVHCLTGNHEEINMLGIAFDYPDYVTVEQFKSFLPDDYIRPKENGFRQRWLAMHPSVPRDSSLPPGATDPFWKDAIRTDEDAQTHYLNFFHQHYGQWIAQHNAVIKINETVFVHGGISLKYSLMPLSEINDLYRSEFEKILTQQQFQTQILYVPDGPLWYRDLARSNGPGLENEVDLILSNLKARHLVIGHTYLNSPSAKTMERFKGKVWVIDTGISRIYGGHLSALIIEGDNFQVWGVNNGQD